MVWDLIGELAGYARSLRPDRGVVFIPFHYREAAANVLTSSTAVDPICKIPELKVATVRIEKAEDTGSRKDR